MDTYVFDPKDRTFVISQGASLGYATDPGLSTTLARSGVLSPNPGDYTLSVTHNLGIAGLGVMVSVNWPAATWIGSTDANSFSVFFSAPAPANVKIYWEVSDTMPIDQVNPGDFMHTIYHGRGNNDLPLFFTPNWPSVVWDSTPDRTNDTALVYFSQPAPVNAFLMWRAGE